MASTGRQVTLQIEQCYTQIGETDRIVVGDADDFIEQGRLPKESVNEVFFNRVAEWNAADTEQTRVSRMHSVLEAGLEVLEAAKGPGLNLLNIAGRTGLIIALATVLRQIVSYYTEQSIARRRFTGGLPCMGGGRDIHDRPGADPDWSHSK
jgi:hypothetical protein